MGREVKKESLKEKVCSRKSDRSEKNTRKTLNRILKIHWSFSIVKPSHRHDSKVPIKMRWANNKEKGERKKCETIANDKPNINLCSRFINERWSLISMIVSNHYSLLALKYSVLSLAFALSRYSTMYSVYIEYTSGFWMNDRFSWQLTAYTSIEHFHSISHHHHFIMMILSKRCLRATKSVHISRLYGDSWDALGKYNFRLT